MAEWIAEAGIGESRSALIEGETILEARIDRDDGRPRFGDVRAARLRRKAGASGRGEVELDGGSAALLSPVPTALTEGAALMVEIVREAIPERGNPKLPLARPADGVLRSASTLAEAVDGRALSWLGPDVFEQAGWSELLDQAATGLVPFSGGLLRIDLTAAMTVIDVDGDLPPAELAIRGAAAAGLAIRRLGIAGAIGIDLPTMPDKAARIRAAEALDAALPQPFERTAVNGFGFLQIVRRRVRPSLLELIQSDPVRADALALIRRLERGPAGSETITAPPAIASLISSRPDWLSELARRRGGLIRIEPALHH